MVTYAFILGCLFPISLYLIFHWEPDDDGKEA
jgi:hypothetical protein